MPTAAVKTFSVTEDSAFVLLGRIVGDDGEPLVQGDLESITYKVFDTTDGTETDSGILDISTCVFVLDTDDPRWDEDDEGINFAAPLTGDGVPEGDRVYQAEVKFTPNEGGTFYVIWKLRAAKIYSDNSGGS